MIVSLVTDHERHQVIRCHTRNSFPGSELRVSHVSAAYLFAPDGAWVDSQGRYSAPGEDCGPPVPAPEGAADLRPIWGEHSVGIAFQPGAEYRPWL